MSDPVQPDAGGLADATSNSISMVTGAVWNAIFGTLRVMGPVLIGAAVLVLGVAIFIIVGRIRAEAAAGKRALDPRPMFDPTASDVLGEW